MIERQVFFKNFRYRSFAMTKSEGLFETNWKRLAFVAALILCAFFLDRYFDREVAGIRCPSEFSTDPAPRLVQLFDDVRDDPHGLFQLRLPKSWSFCEYNHSFTRQIQVELMLDKATLAPLTEVALRERRLGWVGDLGRLMNQYRDRQLIVYISALISPSSSEVARLHQKAITKKRQFGRANDFEWYDAGFGYEAEVVGEYKQQRTANGASVEQPDLFAHCFGNVMLCSVTFPYRGAGVRFHIPFAELGRAVEIRKGLTAKLESIRVKNPAKPELLN